MTKILKFLCLVATTAPMLAQLQGPISTPQVNSTLYVGAGFYPNIQSAVTSACAVGSGRQIVIPAAYAGGDAIASVTGGCSAAYIVDQRSVAQSCFSWSGAGPYAPTPCSSSPVTFPITPAQGGTGNGAGGTFTGIRKANGTSPDTAASSSDLQSGIGAGVYAPLNNPTGGQNNYAPLASATFTGTTTIPAAAITGGSINGTVIGGTTPNSGAFTTVVASSAIPSLTALKLFGDSITAGCCNAPARVTGHILTTAQQALTNFTTVTNGAFGLSVDGGAVIQYTGTDFSAATSLTQVASILDTKIGSGVNVVWTGYTFTVQSAGTPLSSTQITAFTSPTGGGTDISSLLGLSSSAGAVVTAADQNFQPWATQLGTYLGVPYTNVAVSGATSFDQASQIYATTVPDTGLLSFYAIGTNNYFVLGGTNAFPGGITANGPSFSKSDIEAEMEWLAIPDSQKVKANTACTGAGWAASSLQTWTFGAVSTTSGATCTFNVTGSEGYFNYTVSQGSGGTFTVVGDAGSGSSVNMGTFTSAPAGITSSQLWAGNLHVGSGGSGYTVGDVLVPTLSGASGVTITVSAVSSGVITAISFAAGTGTGFYSAVNVPLTGGTGTGARVDLNCLNMSQQGRTYGPQTVRIPFQYNGQHTITVTITSATDANNLVYPDWASGNGYLLQNQGPQLIQMGVVRQAQGSVYPDSLTSLYDDGVRQNVNELGESDGLYVTYGDNRASQCGILINNCMNLDWVHPNGAGHYQYFLAAQAAANALINPNIRSTGGKRPGPLVGTALALSGPAQIVGTNAGIPTFLNTPVTGEINGLVSAGSDSGSLCITGGGGANAGEKGYVCATGGGSAAIGNGFGKVAEVNNASQFLLHNNRGLAGEGGVSFADPYTYPSSGSGCFNNASGVNTVLTDGNGNLIVCAANGALSYKIPSLVFNNTNTGTSPYGPFLWNGTHTSLADGQSCSFSGWDAGDDGVSIGYCNGSTFSVYSAHPSGAAGGDLGGTYPNPLVVGLHATAGSVDGVVIGASAPTEAHFSQAYAQQVTIAPVSAGSLAQNFVPSDDGGTTKLMYGANHANNAYVWWVNDDGSASFPSYSGPANAPTGACAKNGAWVLSQDGRATFCANGTWVSNTPLRTTVTFTSLAAGDNTANVSIPGLTNTMVVSLSAQDNIDGTEITTGAVYNSSGYATVNVRATEPVSTSHTFNVIAQ